MYHVRIGLTRLHESSDLQTCLRTECNLGRHVSEFLLHLIIGRRGSSNLFQIQCILSDRMKTIAGAAQSPPCNSVVSMVQTIQKDPSNQQYPEIHFLWDCEHSP
jgi:hypothetical protein